MVITVRATSKDETAFRRISSSLYYWLFNKISSIPITPKSTDFRLFDKKIVSQFLRMTERNRMFRGIMDWMGFKRAYVSFHADARVGGKSTFSFLRLMHLAITSVTSFSLLPLRITGYLGLLITFCSGGMMLWMAFNYLINSSLNFTPLAIVTVANTFLIGIVLMSIGLVALYVGTIHTEVVNRPLYMVRERINLME
jgi:dolichol-phosphate mannosyltransferase